MEYKLTKGNEIEGELEIFISHNDDAMEGEIVKWDEVLIHGNPEGLKSLAKLLIQIAELNQEKVDDKYLPIGAREHYHLRPGIELSKSSIEVIVGRLDAKGTGDFFERYISKDGSKNKIHR
jgi:ABC-type phosphate transport system substrate-binding protein